MDKHKGEAMKIEDYQLLITLDETKTLRKAAEILYISQPAVTQRLKAIEHAFGVEIFIRTKIQAHIGEVNGTISIGCSSLIGQTILPRVLSLYNTQFPNVEIQVQVGSTEQIRSNHRDYHLLITRGNKVMNLKNIHLFDDEHYFIYPKERHEDVSKLPFIEFQADPIYINQINHWYSEKFGQDYHATITVDQVATCKEMLISGVGVTILPEIMMKNIDHHVFEFEKVNIDGLPLIRSTYMSYDSSILQLPQVDAFVSLMLNFTK